MKKAAVLILTVILAVTLCSCGSGKTQEQKIPLLCVENSGECYLCTWATGADSITQMSDKLFQNKEQPQSLSYTLWDGQNKYIIYDEQTEVLDDSIDASYRQHRIAYYGGYTLMKDGDAYTLKSENTERSFTIDPNTPVGEKSFDQCGLSGFYVKDDQIHIMVNAFSMDDGYIVLYILKFDMSNNRVEAVSEIKNPPKTLSPANPPGGSNVIALDGAFIVFSDTQIYEINIEKCSAKTLFDVETAKKAKIGDSSHNAYLIERMGFFDNALVLCIVGDSQTAFEEQYLCVVDKGEISSSIEVDAEYILPNILTSVSAPANNDDPDDPAELDAEAALDKAVHDAIIAHNKELFLGGEKRQFVIEDHETLKTVDNGDIVEVYLIATYLQYNHVDGKTNLTGGSCSPCAITFEKTGETYTVTDYWAPEDGERSTDSLKERFPDDVDYLSAMSNEADSMELFDQRAEEYFNGK